MRTSHQISEAHVQDPALERSPWKTGFVDHPCGPRLYLAGRRVHHGTAGIALAALALFAHQPRFAALGVAMIAHDAGDFPWRDCDNHAPVHSA
jgi:hypothetical protein